MRTEEDDEFDRIDREQAMGWRKRQIVQTQTKKETPMIETMKQALEAFKAIHGTLTLANEQGLIIDTLWLSEHETLFDYITSEADLLRQSIEQADKQEPVAWKLNVDINNYQGQSEYRTVLAFRPDPAVTGNYEVNEVISAQPLYTSPQPQTDRNFCGRCGKRTADLTVIHTCTPPQGEA